MKNTNVFKAGLLALALSPAAAIATPTGMVTEWGYVNEAGFSTWTSTLGGTTGITESGLGDNSLLPGTATQLSWGTPTFVDGDTNGQSSILVNSPVVGNVFTNGAQVAGTDITHFNWVVGTEGGALSEGTLLDALQLTPLTVDGNPIALPSIDAPELSFFIEFFETPNNVDYDFSPYPNIGDNVVIDTNVTCENGEDNGLGVNVNGCADIFVIGSNDPGVEFGFDPISGDLLFTTSFNFGFNNPLEGWQYDVTTRLSGLTFVNDAACTAVGAPIGCLGFLTQEDTANVLSAGYTIVARHVSEPAPIAIFGALLVAAGFARRKFKA